MKRAPVSARNIAPRRIARPPGYFKPEDPIRAAWTDLARSRGVEVARHPQHTREIFLGDDGKVRTTKDLVALGRSILTKGTDHGR
jgi:hypothetical protein